MLKKMLMGFLQVGSLAACDTKLNDEVIIVGPLNMASDSNPQSVIDDSCRALKLKYVAHDTFADSDGHVSVVVRCERLPK